MSRADLGTWCCFFFCVCKLLNPNPFTGARLRRACALYLFGPHVHLHVGGLPLGVHSDQTTGDVDAFLHALTSLSVCTYCLLSYHAPVCKHTGIQMYTRACEYIYQVRDILAITVSRYIRSSTSALEWGRSKESQLHSLFCYAHTLQTHASALPDDITTVGEWFLSMEYLLQFCLPLFGFKGSMNRR